MKEKYNWLTCPFCNEVAKRTSMFDIHTPNMILHAWVCMSSECELVCFTHESDNLHNEDK